MTGAPERRSTESEDGEKHLVCMSVYEFCFITHACQTTGNVSRFIPSAISVGVNVPLGHSDTHRVCCNYANSMSHRLHTFLYK